MKNTNKMPFTDMLLAIKEYAATNDMNAIEILLENNGYKYHHEAMARGYVSRKTACTPMLYKGRFGRGITLEIPAYNGTQYHYRQYWIEGDC